MKKIMCILLCMTLLLPSFAFANGSELEKVTVSVKQKIEIPKELTEFSSNIFTSANEGTAYNLSWADKDGKSQVRVTVNENGDIVNYSKYNYDRDYVDSGMSKFDKSYFVETAKTWLEKVNPSWISELDFDVYVDLSSLYNETVNVNLQRKVNGLSFCDNYADVSINKYTGDVERFYANWTYAKSIPDTSEMLPNEELKKLFEEKSGVVLKYMTKHDSKDAVLVYVPKDESIVINAITGETENPEVYFGNMKESIGATNDALREESTANGLTKEEIAEIERMDNLISRDKALKIAKAIENTDISKYDYTNIEYIKRKDGEEYKYLVTISFENEKAYASVTLDAESGSLISLYSNDYNEKKGNKIKAEKQRTNADKFIEKYASNIADKVEVFEDMAPRFKYSHSVNGIEYELNNAIVNVDEYTGKITRYSYSWRDDVEFSDTEGIISSDEALDILYDKVGFKKYYFNTKDGVKIGYALNNDTPYYIDAVSGKILEYNLDEYKSEDEKRGTAKDLDGHYAKEYIDKLMQNGIIKYEETFRPDDKVTVKEALEFLNCLDRGYIPFDKTSYMYISLAGKIFDSNEYDENALVTRQMAAKFLVRARSDYGEIAEMNIFDSGFNDRLTFSNGFEGYAAILKGMGVVQGDDAGNFNPQNDITRADFTILLYKYLNK